MVGIKWRTDDGIDDAIMVIGEMAGDSDGD